MSETELRIKLQKARKQLMNLGNFFAKLEEGTKEVEVMTKQLDLIKRDQEDIRKDPERLTKQSPAEF